MNEFEWVFEWIIDYVSERLDLNELLIEFEWLLGLIREYVSEWLNVTKYVSVDNGHRVSLRCLSSVPWVYV